MSPRMFGPTASDRMRLTRDISRDLSHRYHPKPDAGHGISSPTRAQRLKAQAANAERTLARAQASSLASRRGIPITLAKVKTYDKPNACLDSGREGD